MHILVNGRTHGITEQDLYNETLDALRRLVEATEEVNTLYNAHLYNRVFDAKAFGKLRSALSRQSRALMALRGPSHDPYNWALPLEHHEPR